MGDFRIPNGFAYGRLNNFFARTDNLFAEADSSPDVTLGSLWFSNNSTNTTITHFDLTVTGPIPGGSGHGNYAGAFEGKEINVMFLDGSTRLVNGGNLILSTSDGLQGANNTIRLIYHNSAWIEFSRSYNNSSIVSVSSLNLGVAGIVSVLGNVKTVQISAEAGTNSILRRATGGEQGQIITLIASGGSDALIVVNSAANDTFVSTSSASSTQFRLMSSGAISFVRYLGRWLEIRPVSGNSSGQLQ